jgi:hypothetical protein
MVRCRVTFVHQFFPNIGSNHSRMRPLHKGLQVIQVGRENGRVSLVSIIQDGVEDQGQGGGVHRPTPRLAGPQNLPLRDGRAMTTMIVIAEH